MSVNGTGGGVPLSGVAQLKPPTLRPGQPRAPIGGAIGAARPVVGAIGAARPVGAAIGASRPVGAIGAPKPVITPQRPTAVAAKPGVQPLIRPTLAKPAVPAKAVTGLRPPASVAARGTTHTKMRLVISGVGDNVKEHDLRLFFQTARIPVARMQMQTPDTAKEGDEKEKEAVALADILVPAQEDAEVAADFACHRLNGSEVGGQKVTVEVKGPVEEEAAPAAKGWTPLQALNRLKQQAMANSQGGAATGVAAAALKGMQQGAEVQQRAGRWKVELCTFFKENKCTKGALCPFAHGEEELNKDPPSTQTAQLTPAERLRKLAELRGLVPPKGQGPATPPPAVRPGQQPPVVKKAQLCSFWQEGRCTRGSLCAYAHGENELHKEERTPIGASRNISEEVRNKLREARERHQGGWKGSGKDGKSRMRGRPDRKGREALIFSHEDMLGPAERVKAQVLENGKAMGWNPIMKAKMAPTEVDEVDQEDKPATFLLNEDGVPYLFETYGLGAQLLVHMGWQPGGGVGKQLQGRMEPVSVEGMQASATHLGRRDRRCLGIPRPSEQEDSEKSDESLEAPDDYRGDRGGDRDGGRGERRRGDRKRSRSRSSSYSSSRSRRRGRRKKLRPKKRSRSGSRDDKKDRSARKKKRTRSSSKSSSSSSRSSSSRGKKRKRPFSTTPASASAGSGTAGASQSAAPKAAPAAEEPVKEDPAIAHEKKKVLAKLTVMKNIEPKEQRMKEFRQMLREWHPDKNPERIEMATAVFQFLQKGKSLLNLK